jgi:hypothetical protein
MIKWQHICYQSGTQIVTDNEPNQPHYYIYGPKGDTNDTIRYQICEALEKYLNGGPRPPFLNDYRRTSPTEITHPDGSRIFATGPVRDQDPPNCNWIQREDPEAVSLRIRLIDNLGVTE